MWQERLALWERDTRSRTVVSQLRLTGDYGVDARDRTQICVDGLKVMVRHVSVDGPWHYLQTCSVERKGDATWIARAWWTGGRVEAIHVDTGPDDLNKLLKGTSAFRQPGFVRRHIARASVHGTCY